MQCLQSASYMSSSVYLYLFLSLKLIFRLILGVQKVSAFTPAWATRPEQEGAVRVFTLLGDQEGACVTYVNQSLESTIFWSFIWLSGKMRNIFSFSLLYFLSAAFFLALSPNLGPPLPSLWRCHWDPPGADPARWVWDPCQHWRGTLSSGLISSGDPQPQLLIGKESWASPPNSHGDLPFQNLAEV